MRSTPTFAMIQHANDITLIFIPNKHTTIHTPEQDRLTLIDEYRTKFITHLGNDSFVFHTVDLLNIAFTVGIPSYIDETSATTYLGNECLSTCRVNVDVTAIDNVSYMQTF